MVRIFQMASLAVLALFGSGIAALAAPDNILVEIDRAHILRLEQPASSIILGNPSIADATVQDLRTLVLTGKSAGSTNLIVLDGDGREVMNRVIEVQPMTTSAMTIFRGPGRQSYACTPVCEPAVRPGDSKDYFDNVLAATQARNAQSVSGN